MKDIEIRNKLGALSVVKQNLQRKNQRILPAISKPGRKNGASLGGLIILLMSFFTGVFCLYGVSEPTVRLIGKLEFPTGNESLQRPWDFCVIDNELFMVSDYGAGNVKIYDRNGSELKLVKILGQKGFGVGNLVEPAFCFYDPDGRFGVFDFGKRQVTIYKRKGRVEFEREQDVYCPRAGDDFLLMGDRLWISGYERDERTNKTSELYEINLSIGEKTLFLPSHQKHGFESDDEYNRHFWGKPGFRVLGRKGWFDIQGDSIYYIWEADITRIIRLDINSGKVISVFGQTPSYRSPYYNKPKVTPELIEAYNNRDGMAIQSEWDKVSYVKNIFASSYVMVIYRGPVELRDRPNFWVRFFTLAGKFLSETRLPGRPDAVPDSTMFLDKGTGTLYSLNKSGYILEYKTSDEVSLRGGTKQ